MFRQGLLVRRRVLAYVTRERDGRRELLVFDQEADPGAGTPVPAGRLDRGDTLESGLLRELHEESGLERATIVRELDAWNTRYENHAFEVRIDREEVADTWEHVVHGDGDDAGLVFRYRWEPVRPDLMLFNRIDPILENL
jgi:ADP-ribose pyrophosphatase YjhB (NUDIX family)